VGQNRFITIFASLSLGTLFLTCSDSETARLRNAANSQNPDPSASISPENLSVVEAPSEDGLEVSLDKTKLKINPNAVSGAVKLKASITKISDDADPAVILAGGTVVKIDVINAQTGVSIDASEIDDSFVVTYDASDRAGQRSDLIMLSPNGDRIYVPFEKLQTGTGLNLLTANTASTQIQFKIPEVAEVGVIFWIADYRELDDSFSEKQLVEITKSGGSGTSTGTSASSSTTASSGDATVGGLDTGSSTGAPDETAPTVTQVTSSTANGSYKVGSTISVQVGFSEPVVVNGGSPYLVLETGSIDRNASFVSGSGTSVLNFEYTVQSNDTSSDLEVLSVNALMPTNASFRDAAGNDAILTLPTLGGASSLSGLKNIKIDTTNPPALSDFLGASTGSGVQLTFDWPASTADYSSVVIRRVTGTTAPADCVAAGTIRGTITNFSSDPHIYNDSAPTGTYSYRACVFDAAGNSVFDVAENISVTSTNSWGSATTWTALKTGVIKAAIGSDTSKSSVVFRMDPLTDGNDNLYWRSYSGTAWSGETEIDLSGSSYTIGNHSTFYDTDDVLRHIYDGPAFCEPLKSSHSIELMRGQCAGIAGPSSKSLAFSNWHLSGVTGDPSEMALSQSGVWTEIPIDPNLVLARAGFDNDGKVISIFHNGSGVFNLKRWNPSGSPTYNDWDSTVAMPGSINSDFVELHTSVSGAIGAFFANVDGANNRNVMVKRRSTGGSWQSDETMANNTSGHQYKMSAGVDATGRMIVFYQSSTTDLYYRLFNGSAWATQVSLGSGEIDQMASCSHPDSDDIFFVWTSNAVPTNILYGVRMSNGVVDETATTIHSTANRYINQIDISCNANGQAVVGFYQYNTQGIQKDYGAAIYGP
jgi:hypothetical protein